MAYSSQAAQGSVSSDNGNGDYRFDAQTGKFVSGQFYNHVNTTNPSVALPVDTLRGVFGTVNASPPTGSTASGLSLPLDAEGVPAPAKAQVATRLGTRSIEAGHGVRLTSAPQAN